MIDKGTKQHKILITDDSELNRSVIGDILKEEYSILEARDGLEAVTILQRHRGEISLLLLDIVMPKMDGLQVLEAMNEYGWIAELPVIIISSESNIATIERAYELGVTDYISRPFDASIVRRRVNNTIMLYSKQKLLVNMVAEQIYEKQKNNNLMIHILSHIVEFRNGESGTHVLHINNITELLLQKVIEKSNGRLLTQEQAALISTASALHDIGKIAIPEDVLNKPGRLTETEYDIMKRHSMIGANMINMMGDHKQEELVQIAYEICRWHHERYDGNGYPDGLKGDEIPLSAQIVSLADVYDALTSERVYKKAYSHAQASSMIVNGECGVFNPFLLECLLEIEPGLQEDLQEDTIARNSRQEIHNIAEKMMLNADLEVVDRNIRDLEREREKYYFYASMTREILFEYTFKPSLLTISEWGAHKLGVRENIIDPLNDADMIDIMGKENLNALEKLLKSTTPKDPVIQFDCEIKIGGEPRWHRLICKVQWVLGEKASYTGIIGKVIDIHEEYN